MSDDERRKLVSTEVSLGLGMEPKMPTGIEGAEARAETDGRAYRLLESGADREAFLEGPYFQAREKTGVLGILQLNQRVDIGARVVEGETGPAGRRLCPPAPLQQRPRRESP